MIDREVMDLNESNRFLASLVIAKTIGYEQFILVEKLIDALYQSNIDFQSLEGPCGGEKTVCIVILKSRLLCEIDERDIFVTEIIKPNVFVEKYVFSGDDMTTIIAHIRQKMA